MHSAFDEPRICTDGLPKEERDNAWLLVLSLSNLRLLVKRFSEAVDLYGVGETGRQQAEHPIDFSAIERMVSWKAIAARDASHTIYEFSETMRHVKHNYKTLTPTICRHVDHRAIVKARRLFTRYFRAHKELRHGSAHASETISSIEQRDAHAVANGLLPYMGCMMRGYRYTTTWKGSYVSMDMVPASVVQLDEVRRAFIEAFRPVAVYTDKIVQDRMDAIVRGQSIRPSAD